MEKKDVALDGRACLEALAAFAPRLREAEAPFGSMSEPVGGGSPGNAIQMPYWDHSALAGDFMKMAYEFGWVSNDFDWTDWNKTEEGSRLLRDPSTVAEADIDQLARLMTAIMRLDRFIEGSLADYFENGIALAVAERAEAILRSGTGFKGVLKHRPW